MPLDIEREVVALRQMPTAELKSRYVELIGEPPVRHQNQTNHVRHAYPSLLGRPGFQ